MSYYNCTYNSNAQNQKDFPKNSIVIFIHGYQSDYKGMNYLINNILSLGPIKNYYNMIDGNIVINGGIQEDGSEVTEIKKICDNNPDANVMVRMAFVHEKKGSIDEQSDELFNRIRVLKDSFSDKKIVTVGHSKGGVVAMDCAIKNPGKIDKLISINTPYTTTIAEHLYDFVSQLVINTCGHSLFYIWNNPLLFAAEYVAFSSDIVQNTFKKIVESIMDNSIVKLDLKQRWNRLENKPKFTPIATRALVLDGNKESDFAVPIESALANGFDGKSYSNDVLLVKNDNYKIPLIASYYKNPFDLISLIAMVNSFTSVTEINGIFSFLNNFFPLLLSATLVDSDVKIRTADFVHAKMDWLKCYLGSERQCLDNPTVALRVLAGLED